MANATWAIALIFCCHTCLGTVHVHSFDLCCVSLPSFSLLYAEQSVSLELWKFSLLLFLLYYSLYFTSNISNVWLLFNDSSMAIAHWFGLKWSQCWSCGSILQFLDAPVEKKNWFIFWWFDKTCSFFLLEFSNCLASKWNCHSFFHRLSRTCRNGIVALFFSSSLSPLAWFSLAVSFCFKKSLCYSLQEKTHAIRFHALPNNSSLSPLFFFFKKISSNLFHSGFH